ncbi:expansin EXLX1 family cellulose-binding protein [Streptomyces sp. DT2A-34]|uniref:expansin EXLX1 family cellulose-binding protein n=1 Tax=Streptomyces sp. DT2A-34 TaxID=3051182 RepID=UPI00265BAB72|nr:expansin EXLX1 family cellulose-binding protein [Streptomyces sp. DT2A-34]MDO0913293.1 expansin EXLX1 family cellulose-binding protein [Streptomyces sp. DT2A-34]
MASRSHRRSPRKWHTALVPAAVVAAVALAASLLMVLRPDGETTAGHAAGAPAAATQSTSPRKTPMPHPTRKPKPTKATTPAATPATTTPRPRATPTTARPSAKATPRPASATAPLAGRLRPDVTYEGVATFYDTGNGDGACLYGPTDDVMTAAMNHTDYETSKACGAYVRVRAANGASVTVRVTNECPLPCAPGQLDLSAEAFAELAAPSAGRIPVTWSLLSPSTSDTISIRYKTGSSRHWCGIQAVGHRNPLARLEVRDGSGWRQLPRAEYNYFLSEQGSGCGGEIRVTDIYGEALAVEGLAIRPDALQPTRLQFAAR